MGDNSTCEVKGRGTVYIQKYINATWIDERIDDVLRVPDLKKEFIFDGLTQKGFDLRLTSDNVYIFSGKDLVAYGKRGKIITYI